MALIVKRSRLPKAGKGLFTTKMIEKDVKIIQYRGETIGWKDYHDRVKKEEDGYLFFFSRKHCVDAFHTPQYKARFANDARGIVRVNGLKNNCHYEIHDNKCYIVSARKISAGEEIFCDYTRGYWKSILYNIKLKKKQDALKRKKLERKKAKKKRGK